MTAAEAAAADIGADFGGLRYRDKVQMDCKNRTIEKKHSSCVEAINVYIIC